MNVERIKQHKLPKLPDLINKLFVGVPDILQRFLITRFACCCFVLVSAMTLLDKKACSEIREYNMGVASQKTWGGVELEKFDFSSVK